MVGNLFIAVVPPESIALALAAVQSNYDIPGVSWEPAQSMHVTMRFFGSMDEEQALVALRSLQGITRVTGVRLGGRPRTFGSRVLYAPVQGLDELAASVVERTSDVGRPPDQRPFVGHITLARASNGCSVPRVKQRFKGQFDVNELMLMRSARRAESGSVEYAIVESVALAGCVPSQVLGFDV